jgi:transposase, IS30 family
MQTKHKRHAHLSQEERYRIEALLLERYTLRGVASSLGRDVSVISREIRRNHRSDGSYTATFAAKMSQRRREKAKVRYRKIENDPMLSSRIEILLRGDHARGDWSPAAIANTTRKALISHKTIYAWIKRSRKDLRVYLHHQGGRRASYGSVATRKYREMSLPSIEKRPAEVATRKVLGHFEGDTMVVKGGRLQTLVERKSRFLIMDGVRQHGPGLAMEIADSAVAVLGPLPVTLRKTVTYDQGSEFAWWDYMEKQLTGTKIYFARAHHPWERGTNERTNGLLRRYFPTSTQFATLPHGDIARAVWRLNHRPRKILHWCTPCEVFGHCCTSKVN